ncbi:MAG: amidohydrolase family protein, partial [Rubrobacter sp.]|nr:amidohydrolase family protein [Rubrobacter sp.]
MQHEIGTVEEGKLADLLVVEGNPLEDISVLRKKANLKLIMKGGRITKNSLEEGAE